MPTSDDLRKLAAWYREFAERAGNPAIWEARLRTAKQLEAEADRADANTVFAHCQVSGNETFGNEPTPSGRKKAAQTARVSIIGYKRKAKSETKELSQLRTMGKF